jgi:hypothetical protein
MKTTLYLSTVSTKSGDIAVHTEGVKEKAQLEKDDEWVKEINPKARVVKRT